MFREDKVVKQSVNYEFLINYLKEIIVNDDFLDALKDKEKKSRKFFIF